MSYAQEKIKPYSGDKAKTEQVEAMFNHIAPSYDLLNHFLSMGIDKTWRKKAIRALAPYAHKDLLDVATGTGDFAILAAQMLKPVRLVGCDISDGMMQIAEQKVKEAGLSQTVCFQHEDCLHLSFSAEKFDAITVAFGIRNFENLDKGLSEMLRVLKVGGKLVILELSAPKRFPMKQLFWLYSHVWMPIIGKLVSKDKSAYKYLPATMEVFPQGKAMQGILKKIGFSQVEFYGLTCGLCTLYIATK